MVRKRLTYLILATAWVTMLAIKFSAVDVQAGQAAQQAGADRKIWDGVFTAEQAARGKPRFDASCSRCHNVELARLPARTSAQGELLLVEVRK